MARPAARTTPPLVFVFRLGAHAKVGKKRVPAAYADAPCYLHRESEGARTRHLDAMPETPVAEHDAETLFKAIELLIERRDLLHELCTESELDAGMSPTYTTGFHPGVSLDDACAALARGGFKVVRVED